MGKEFSMPCGGKLSLKYVVLKPMEIDSWNIVIGALKMWDVHPKAIQ